MVRHKKGNPIHGWLVIDKPKDIGSTPIVGKIKRKLNAQKAGHGGTLDPFASGLLAIALGEATKTVPWVMDGIKEYIFDITFGESRDSDDIEGNVIATCDKIPTREEIEKVIPTFLGKIEQTPPIYSAIKVDGKRAYDLARQGVDVELKSRKVELFELEIIQAQTQGTIRLRAVTSKGFYIRSLGRDLAKACGSLAYVSYLRRISSGKLSINNAISLDKFEQLDYDTALNKILPIETVLDDILALALNGEEAQDIEYGRSLKAQNIFNRCDVKKADDGDLFLVKYQNKPLALMFYHQGQLKTQRKFNI
ncbi:MAG: tRNA pseudouridine(55) synthase TruB [Alphaproteobacteria bacterium]